MKNILKLVMTGLIIAMMAICVNAQNEVKIDVSMQEANTFYVTHHEITVTAGKAKSYGYSVKSDDAVYALDALVAIHEEMFGADFTPKTANTYLVCSSSGFLTKIMGVDTYNFGFIVNGKSPHDGILNNGYYGGLTAGDAALKQNDKIEFVFFMDSYGMDKYVWFTTKDTVVGKGKVSLNLSGYPIMWYGCSPQETIDSMITNSVDAKIFIGTTPDNMIETTYVTDANGNVVIDFDTEGTYYLSAKGGAYDPTISPVFKMEVKKIIGDASNDGTVTSYDASLLLQYLAKIITISKENLSVCDIDSLGNITSFDVSLMLQYLSKIKIDYAIGTPIK